MKQNTTEIALTQAQMGAACGITQSQASRDLRAAGIEPAAAGYTLEHLARLAAWRALEQVGAADDGKVYNGEAERARLLANQADLAELKVREERRELVRMAQVEATWAAIGSTMRGKLVSLPSRLAALIPETQPRVRFQQQADVLIGEVLGEIRGAAGEIAEARTSD